MSRQSGEDFTGPMAELLLGGASGIELRHRAFPNNGAEVIDLGAKLGQHGRNKNFVLADAERFGGFDHHVNMSRWFGMEQLVRELFRHSRHQITMLTKEVDVFMIRSRFE